MTLEQRWLFQFFVGILLAIDNGACFCFGIFSPYLKIDGFRYTQSQISIISTVGVLLSYFSLPTGFLYDWKGPGVTLGVGTVLNVVGWAGMLFIFADAQHSWSSGGGGVVVMCLFYGLAQLSASFYETGCILTNLDAFSCYEGRVIIVQKTFMGLGSSIAAQVYVAFFAHNDRIAFFFLFLLSYSAVVGVLGVAFTRLPSPSTRCLGLNVLEPEARARGYGESRLFLRPFNLGTALLGLTVALIFAVSMVESYVELGGTTRIAIGLVTLALCLSFLGMVVITPSYHENAGGFRADLATPQLVTKPFSAVAVVGSHTALPDAASVPTTPTSSTQAAQPTLPWRGEDECHEDSRHEDSAIDLSVCSVASAQLTHEQGSASRAATVTQYGSTCLVATPGVHDLRDTVVVRTASDAAKPTRGKAYAASAEPVRELRERPRLVMNGETLWVNMRHRDIWLLWFVCFASWSSMTVVSSNSSQIYLALAGDRFSLTVNSVFVSVFGVASATGRIVVGAADPRLRERGISIAHLLAVPPLLNVVGMLLFLLVPLSLLFVPFLLVGLATGISWGSTVLVITSLFAHDNRGKHYSWLYTAGMLSPLVFNLGLFGPLYDHYSSLQGRDDDHTCLGTVCVAIPLLVCVVVNAVAIAAACGFVRRVVRRGGIVV